MFFFPIGCLIFVLFVVFLPILFVLGYFHIITIGFEKLGISPELTLTLLLLVLICSVINIPIGRKKMVYVEESRFFGLFKKPRTETQGLAINLGGAVIPILISVYFLTKIPLQPVFWATISMIVVSKLLARVVPGKGVSLPVLAPPLFSAILAFLLVPDFAAPCAFVAGTLGVLIGADILNLRRVQKRGGFLSIGGAGVFDGIFLVGVASALLAGL
jgi:uncharacterized membrane protein